MLALGASVAPFPPSERSAERHPARFLAPLFGWVVEDPGKGEPSEARDLLTGARTEAALGTPKEAPIFGVFFVFHSVLTKFVVSLFSPFIQTVDVSLPPTPGAGRGMHRDGEGVGEGRRENRLCRHGSGERGVLCPIAGDPGQRWKSLSLQKSG